MTTHSKPLTETEFRVLVDLRRAVGPPYKEYEASLNSPALDAWVEGFARLLHIIPAATFDLITASNYSYIVEGGVFTPDHPREY